MAERLPILTSAEDEALLRDAGFADVSLFYAAFSFRGWVASASQA
jgi:tRNA (cmo5U34)-methyltransferase